MRMKLGFGFIILSFLFSSTLFATGITFTFANEEITGTSPKYYEFDVMAQASASGTRIGGSQVYINYNTAAFGTRIVVNSKITVTKGTLLQGGSAPAFYYTIVNNADNTDSRVAITVDYNYPGSPEYGNSLPTGPTQWAHVKIEISNQSQNAGLSYQQNLMAVQEYESDNNTKYNPVTANDSDDSSLPVQLSSFTAAAGEGMVILAWKTESEVNNLGFNIYRSMSENADYQKINSEMIVGAGNSTSAHNYSYQDENIESMGTYYYKLEGIDLDGTRKYNGPISVEVTALTPQIPSDYFLSQNFPNPFNPDTEIKYQIPETGLVDIGVYNLLGQKMATLVQKKLEAGYYSVKWAGKDDFGAKVGSGVYIIRIVTGKFTDYRKVLLLK